MLSSDVTLVADFAAEHSVVNMDGTSRNDRAVSFIREQWIRKQMGEREGEFTADVPVRVFCGTWNVNGKKLGDDDPIEDWVPVERAENLCDIYAIGFQEMVDLTVTNVTMDGKSAQRHRFWEEKLLRHLNEGAARHGQPPYVNLGTEHLVGILLCVFARESTASRVSGVVLQSVPCGAMGVVGNKGGIVCRMKLQDSWICFVCAHLAAHRGNTEGRNANYHAIMERAHLASDGLPEEPRSSAAHYVDKEPHDVASHEVVFFLGDLNYRISVEVDLQEVLYKCTKDLDMPFLLGHDQLNLERAAGRVFEGFEEGDIGFLPTYKFEPGSDRYEQREGKKKRAPAWCDRVLWSAKRGGSVALRAYRSSMVQRISDHKPVSAFFDLRARRIDRAAAQDVLQSVLRSLDRWENDAQPQVELSSNFVALGPVRYGVESAAEVVLKNVGDTPAIFRFVPKPLEDSDLCCKPFMTLSPAFGMVLPEESARIRISVNVDDATARRLALGDETLSDILILRLEGGRDIFVDVSGDYARSCYGASLQELVNATQPMREVPVGGQEGAAAGGESPQAVPNELWRMLDELYVNGARAPDLFFAAGDPEMVARVREALDTGAELPGDASAHDVAEALTSFLRALGTPVIPREVAASLDVEYTSQNLAPWTRRFLETLPPACYNTFVYLVSFFRYLLDYRHYNRLTPTKVASTLGRVLLAGEKPRKEHKEKDKTRGGMLSDTFDDVVDGAANMDLPEAPPGKQAQSLRRTNIEMILVHLLTSAAL